MIEESLWSGEATGPDDDSSWVAVYAPATVANVGPGFDCFGLALEEPGDVVRARLTGDPGVRIVSIDGDGGALPREADQNTAAVAAAAVWRAHAGLRDRAGLELRISKGLPAGSGLGSSAASAVAGAVAAMHVVAAETCVPCDEDLVLEAALQGETVASGQRHADNVAPALMGGFVLVQGVDPPRIARFEPRIQCRIAVVTPALTVSTRQARAVLPRQVPLADAVANWSNASAVVLALLTGDEDLLRRCMVDRVVEPHRARLIPGFEAARQAALDAGALGVGISGSGPTVFAMATADETARSAGAVIAEVFQAHGLESTRVVSRISSEGARRR